MQVPGAHRAEIDPRKVRDYLLSHDHVVGRVKAPFFEALGFTRSGWHELSSSLLRFLRTEEALPSHLDQFGQRYVVLGTLHGPAGRSARVVTVWVVLTGEETPRFVTAYPDPRR